MTEQSPLLDQPAVRELLETGAREGKISYDRINQMLGDMTLDVEDTEELLQVLENRGIQVVDSDEAASATPSRAPKAATRPAAPKPKTHRGSSDKDLDEVLAKIESFFTPSVEPSSTQSPNEEQEPDENALSDAATALLDDDADETGAAVNDALTQYLQQMGRVPLLSPEEEQSLARLAREGSPEEQTQAKQHLVEANLRLVVHIARRYKGRGVLPLLDIVQEGNLGLIRAVERWVERSASHPNQRLSSYVTWYIREAINRAIAAQSRSIRLPGHISETLQKLQRLTRELTQQLGRAPSRLELAEAAGLTESQVEELTRVVAEPLSLDRSTNDDEESGELGEMLSGDENDETPLQNVSAGDLQAGIREAMSSLSEREAAVVMQRFGLGEYSESGPRSPEAIADNLHLSRERVRQLEVRALRKLRRRVQGTPLGELFNGIGEE